MGNFVILIPARHELLLNPPAVRYSAMMRDPYAPHRSLASILAIIAAIASFWVHSGILGFILAIVAIVLGVIGFLIAWIPGRRGGLLSLLAMLLGVIGAFCGILKAVFHLGQNL
jgi:hypothetical protein